MSFADYLGSLGAYIKPTKVNSTYSPGVNEYGGGTRTFSKIGYGYGQQIPGLTAQQQGFRDRYGDNVPNQFASTGAYVDESGGFLGYGSNPDQLYSSSPRLQQDYASYTANEPGRIADVEAQNIANKQARFQYEQDYQAAQSAKLAAQQAQPSFANSGLTGLMGQQQAPQQGGYGRGSGFAPGQQYAGGMGRGAGQGLLGGMGRGGPTGGGQ